MATFTLPDPYEGKTPEEMKQRARDLIHALSRWQHIAMSLADGRGVESLPREWQEELRRHLKAYED